MLTLQRTVTLALIFAFVLTTLGVPVASAAAGASLAGKYTIETNRAEKIHTGPGGSGGGKFLGISIGGQRGDPKNTETNVQNVVNKGATLNADVTIRGNRASDISNTGSRVNVQSVISQ